MKAERLGKPYRRPGVGQYQTFIVTFNDGKQTTTEVPTAYGRQSASVAKLNAERQRSEGSTTDQLFDRL